jgi:hypothetical protein
MEVFSFTSFGKELDFVIGTGSLEPLARERCFACFSRRCLEVSGAKSRDIIEQCALRQREGCPCVKALRKVWKSGDKWVRDKSVRVRSCMYVQASTS